MNPLGRLRALAADAGVRAAATSRAIALVGAPVSLYLAATRLPPRTQGYYFVALNVVALAQLFELGLGTIIVQFASHEWPRLRWGRRGGLEGDLTARDTVAALLVAGVRWFGVAALVLFGIAGLGGVLVYGGRIEGSFLDFATFWCGIAVLTALYLPLVPFVCTAEGCGDLIAVQRMRSWQAAAMLAALWSGIVAGSALGAVWLAATAQVVVALIWLARRHRGLLQAPRSLPAHLLSTTHGQRARYAAEQRRSAQLWLALHLAPQMLAPVLLRVRGGDEAGRMGVTVALAIAPLTIAVAWLHGRYPSFGAMIAEGRTDEFDAFARRAGAEAVLVFVASSVALTGVVLLLPFVLPALAARVLPVGALLALLLGSFVGLLLQAMAGYLRAFRDEAIAPVIVGGTVATVLVSGAAAVFGGSALMAAGYAASSLFIALPLAGRHFVRVRRERLGGQSS